MPWSPPKPEFPREASSMGRPKKTESEPGDSRRALIRAAWELFLSKGYDATSVDAVNARAGLSKGTFYHNFDSKLDLLEAVVEDLTLIGWKKIEPLLTEKDTTPLKRLNRFLVATRQSRLDRAEEVATLARVVHADENALLREKMKRMQAQLVTGPLAGCLRDGVEVGEMDVEAPEQTASLVLQIFSTALEDVVRDLMNPQQSRRDRERLMKARLRSMLTAVERVLGIDEGSLTRPPREIIRRMVAAFAKEFPPGAAHE